MELLYFNAKTECIVHFKSDEIKEETFFDDIKRIGAVKNGIQVQELFEIIDENEASDLIFTIECNPNKLYTRFYKAVSDKNIFYLSVQNFGIEKVKTIGKNKTFKVIQGITKEKLILQASNVFFEKNLTKVECHRELR